MPAKKRTTKAAEPTAQLARQGLPLQHLLSRIPLQLAAVAFCLYSANDKALFSDLTPTQRILASLVRDPVSFLLTAVPSILIVQGWVGSWLRGHRRAAFKDQKDGGAAPQEATEPKKGFTGAWKDMFGKAMKGEVPVKRMQPRKDGKAGSPLDLNFKYFIPAALTTGAAALVIHSSAVLLGAPLFSRFFETLLLSLLVSALAIFPIAIAIPIEERYVWLRLFTSVDPSDDIEIALLAPALGALIGCWAGALPIPLDWDRPWQAWPVTCVLGSVGGHAIGSVVALAICSYNTLRRTA